LGLYYGLLATVGTEALSRLDGRATLLANDPAAGRDGVLPGQARPGCGHCSGDLLNLLGTLCPALVFVLDLMRLLLQLT
jgi:hypothetical protein